MGTAYSNTHVANATDNYLRIFYQVDKMELDEITLDLEVGIQGGSSEIKGSGSAGTKMTFKRDTMIRYIHLPPRQYTNFAGEGELYASVLVEDKNDRDVCSNVICLNFHVPSDRSFIVTKDENLKLQKYGANIWVDEDGVNHSP